MEHFLALVKLYKEAPSRKDPWKGYDIKTFPEKWANSSLIPVPAIERSVGVIFGGQSVIVDEIRIEHRHKRGRK